MPRRKTNEEFLLEISDLVGDEYTVLEEYKNSTQKILFQHNTCGHSFYMKPNHFLRGQRCTHCNKTKRKTIDGFKNDVFEVVGDEYEVLSTEYINNKTKIDIKHNVCGHILHITPNGFLRGNRCIYCSGKLKKDTYQFQKEMYNLVGDEYSLVSEYTTTMDKVTLLHNCCGHKFQVTPNHFLRGSRCPKCQGVYRKTLEDFKKEVSLITDDEYSVVGDKYINTSSKILMKHNACGNIFNVVPNNFLSNYTRCPACKISSKGELAISSFLDNNNIDYISQKTFDDFKDKKYLSYDFYIPDKNILIEYQGIQHEKPIDFFGGKKHFDYQKSHDDMKRKYAKDNGFILIEIWYYDYKNIEDILVSRLLKQSA